MAAVVSVQAYKGEDLLIPLSIIPPRSINIFGWTFQFTMKFKEGDASPVLQISNASFTITDPIVGLFQCVILASSWTGIAVGAYHFDVWRVDTGSNTCLTVGVLNLLPSSRGGV